MAKFITNVSSLLFMALIVIAVPLRCVVAQEALLAITSPASGTSVSPGQVISVKVTTSPNSGITAVALNYGDWTPIVNGPGPYIFSITIPASAQPGPLPITAVDATVYAKPGVGKFSSPLLLTVKGPTVTSLGTNLRAVHFRFAGSKKRVSIIGYSSGGKRTAFERPDSLTFLSQSPDVAAVEQSGMITALSPGQTVVTATYTNGDSSKVSVSIPVFVPTTTPGDLNGDGKVDLEDEAILQGAFNTQAVGPNDARDLNHDGQIDALDARILVTLCTYPRCATHH